MPAKKRFSTVGHSGGYRVVNEVEGVENKNFKNPETFGPGRPKGLNAAGVALKKKLRVTEDIPEVTGDDRDQDSIYEEASHVSSLKS